MSVSLHDVEVRHLNALRAVAETGTFGRAAERLGYTQSAVSQQIAMLEKLVGGSLFERRGGPRPVEITSLGRRLLAHAESVLDGLAAAEADLDLYLAGQVGTISIGTFQSVSVQVLPKMLHLLRKDRPDLEVKLHEEEDEPELIRCLLSRRLDAIFVAKPPTEPGIEVVPLIRDPLVVISPRNQIELPGERLAPSALDGQPLVAETVTACAALIENGLRKHGVEPNVVFRTHDNSAVQAMVRSGVGHAVMPVLAIDANDPGVMVRLLEPPIPPRQIGLAVLADRELSPAVAHLIELARIVAAELIDTSELLDHP